MSIQCFLNYKLSLLKVTRFLENFYRKKRHFINAMLMERIKS